MCARFPLAVSTEVIERLFMIDLPREREFRHNIAPTQKVLGVTERDGAREPHMFHWGLVPSWAPNASVGTKMINARVETVLEKNTYRAAFKSRRCVIPCSGFYEWREARPGSTEADQQPDLFCPTVEDRELGQKAKKSPKKEPLLFFSPKHPVMAFAGLWESWRQPSGERLLSCTILTTSANEVVSPFHDRMPCLLRPEQVQEWIAPVEEPRELMHLLQPLEASELEYKVLAPDINDSRTEAELALKEALL